MREGVCQETRNRIKLAVAAWAYETGRAPIMTDHEFDALARTIDTNFKTGNEEMDHFFWSEFDPDTGMWVHRHPDLPGLQNLYYKYYVRDDLI